MTPHGGAQGNHQSSLVLEWIAKLRKRVEIRGEDREEHGADRGERRMLVRRERRWSDMHWDSEQAI